MKLSDLLRFMRDQIEEALRSADPFATEAGRVFSAQNEATLRQIATQITQLLAQVQQAPAAQAVQAPPPGAQPVPPAGPVAAAPVAMMQARQSADGGIPGAVEAIAQEAALGLSEAARGGRGLVRVITPGWGSSGFYGRDMLARDAAAAFPAGTKMYWDHPTADEAAQRPERSLNDLAAETTGPARFMDDGPDGAGVYAPASVFSAYRPAIEELKDSIGVSIRASALFRNGEAEGKRGPIIERLLPSPTNTIDFVTIPGRGGRVAALFEAARGRNATPTAEGTMSDAELRAAQEAQRQAEERAARAEAAVAVLAARSIASEVLATIDIPAPAREAVAARVIAKPPMKDGALDADAFRKLVTDEATTEKAYIDRLTGRGEVRGMGSGATEAAGAAVSEDSLATTFRRLGLSESGAKLAAAGRRS